MAGSAQPSSLYIGLMSGTSMDGIDAALCRIGERRCEIVASHSHPYDSPLRDALLAASRRPADCTADDIGELDQRVGSAFRDAALELLRASGTAPADVAAIGSHGQTLRHRPDADRRFTLQIGDPNVIATGTGVTTVADFRRRDMSVGGEGAPLAPAFHHWLLGGGDSRVVLNIGGFANVTILHADADKVSGFDTGPGNSLLDSWCRRHRGTAYDDGGCWAASGEVLPGLLDAMSADPYFQRPPPKSTGFEYFNDDWLAAHVEKAGAAGAADVQATLAELTAVTIARAIDRSAAAARDVVVCGGGAHNAYLLQRLRTCMPAREVRDSSAVGIHPDWVEAAAFAWLASRTLAGLPGNLPAVTGARAPVVLGGIYLATP